MSCSFHAANKMQWPRPARGQLPQLLPYEALMSGIESRRKELTLYGEDRCFFKSYRSTGTI